MFNDTFWDDVDKGGRVLMLGFLALLFLGILSFPLFALGNSLPFMSVCEAGVVGNGTAEQTCTFPQYVGRASIGVAAIILVLSSTIAGYYLLAFLVGYTARKLNQLRDPLLAKVLTVRGCCCSLSRAKHEMQGTLEGHLPDVARCPSCPIHGTEEDA